MNYSSGNMHGMAVAPPGGASTNGTMNMPPHRHMMMHMTFYWGKNALILFEGWPGYDRLGMYILALVVVFFLAIFVEWLSHSKILKDTSGHKSAILVGLLQTVMYSVRVGLAYMVMLAIMSFNGGVFVVAVAGHAVGFFLFGSRAFHNPADSGKTTALPHGTC